MPQSPLAFFANFFSGSLGGGRLGQQKDLWASQRHGTYYNSAYGTPALLNALGQVATPAKAGSVFRGANQTSATFSIALATTYTGLCLSNPATSTVNLAIRKAGCVISSAPSGQIGLGLIVGWAAAGITVHTTPLNTSIVNAYVGAAATGTPPIAGPAPQANLDAACTLVGSGGNAPTWVDWFAANGAANSCTSFFLDSGDSLIIPPGGYAAIGCTAAQGGAYASFQWEETPP